MKFQDYLKEIEACEEARSWNGKRDLQTCWQECDRGDWMLWLMKKGSLCDFRTIILAKARCAELAKPYMKDERSLAALQAAFDFTNGLISEGELRKAGGAAYAAADDASDASDAAAAAAADAAADADAADAAVYAAAAAVYAAYAYAADAADAYAAVGVRAEILKKCADICREVLPTARIENVE